MTRREGNLVFSAYPDSVFLTEKHVEFPINSNKFLQDRYRILKRAGNLFFKITLVSAKYADFMPIRSENRRGVPKNCEVQTDWVPAPSHTRPPTSGKRPQLPAATAFHGRTRRVEALGEAISEPLRPPLADPSKTPLLSKRASFFFQDSTN